MQNNEINQTQLFDDPEIKTYKQFREKHRQERQVIPSEDIEISLAELLEKLKILIKKPITALKYKIHIFLKRYARSISIPWFKLAVVALLAYVGFTKDFQFNMALKSPFQNSEEGNTADYGMAHAVSLSSDNKNPYAPVGVKSLKDKKTLKYIERFSDVAITEMNKFGIPASIKMAQALVESRAGQSKLAQNNNNHFGMKCFSKNCKKGHCTNATDDHHKDFFRNYANSWDSWRSHSQLLSQGRYKKLQKYGKDYREWAKGLKEVGYATDKKYATKLINIIEKYELHKLDK